MKGLKLGKVLLSSNNPTGRLVTLHYKNREITIFYNKKASSYWDCNSHLPIEYSQDELTLNDLVEVWYSNVDKKIYDFSYLTIEPDENGLWTP